MSRVAKFLENELDRVNEYLGMAKYGLVITTELCDERCKRITDSLSEVDEQVIDYLNEDLEKLELKISDAIELIYKFKNFYFNLENTNHNNKIS